MSLKNASGYRFYLLESYGMYGKITKNQEDDIKDVLFRLQAASFNNHLPTFRNCVLAHYNSGNNENINQENILEKNIVNII